MAGTRERGRAIREYIVAQVASHPDDIGHVSAKHFGISRQAVNKHLNRLIADGLLAGQGTTRNRRYSLAESLREIVVVPLVDGTEEDTVWRREIEPLLSDLPRSTREVWQYGFTVMLNNAIDHSSGTAVEILIVRTAVDTSITVADDGEGIFRKITRELQLADERHAVLELAKGKLTTDPEKHTGEGIFFTSRLFDEFNLLSGEVLFSHDSSTQEDWIQETRPITGGEDFPGTSVVLELHKRHDKNRPASIRRIHGGWQLWVFQDRGAGKPGPVRRRSVDIAFASKAYVDAIRPLQEGAPGFRRC